EADFDGVMGANQAEQGGRRLDTEVRHAESYFAVRADATVGQPGTFDVQLHVALGSCDGQPPGYAQRDAVPARLENPHIADFKSDFGKLVRLEGGAHVPIHTRLSAVEGVDG